MDMRRNVPTDGALAVLVTAAVLLIDQITKLRAARGGMVFVPRNPDYAFGVVGGSATVLIVGAVGVLGAFLLVARTLANHFGISVVLPALVAGGTLGNTLDRLRLGSVRDFLVTPWAIVNVADFAVAIGIVGLAIAVAVRVPRLRAQYATATR